MLCFLWKLYSDGGVKLQEASWETAEGERLAGGDFNAKIESTKLCKLHKSRREGERRSRSLKL